MTHKAKVKLARRLQRKNERYNGLFYSQAWLERKWHIRMRLAKREAIAKYYASAKRQRKISEGLPQVV
jgi:hypothetical protein